MDVVGDVLRHAIERHVFMLGGAHQSADQSVTFSERHPCFDEQVREIRGPHRGIERCRHAIRVDRQRLDCSGNGGQYRCERVAGIEQQRFVFL